MEFRKRKKAIFFTLFWWRHIIFVNPKTKTSYKIIIHIFSVVCQGTVSRNSENQIFPDFPLQNSGIWIFLEFWNFSWNICLEEIRNLYFFSSWILESGIFLESGCCWNFGFMQYIFRNIFHEGFQNMFFVGIFPGIHISGILFPEVLFRN